jgi:hypothetical protein
MEATVKTCVKKEKGWTNPEGKEVAIYKVTFTDGTDGEIMAKEIPIGTPLSAVTVTPGTYGNKLKYNKPNGFAGGGKPRAGNESFAMSYAKDLVVAGKVELKDLSTYADKIYQWLESKKSS